MKKYLLISSAALLAITVLNSCGPSGDPKKDAEAFRKDMEKAQELEIEELTKEAEIAEYYAEQGDYKGYKKYKEKKRKLSEKINKAFEKDNKQEIKQLKRRIEKSERKIRKND